MVTSLFYYISELVSRVKRLQQQVILAMSLFSQSHHYRQPNQNKQEKNTPENTEITECNPTGPMKTLKTVG